MFCLSGYVENGRQIETGIDGLLCIYKMNVLRGSSHMYTS